MTSRIIKTITILFFFILFFSSCKTKINQVKNNLQVGRWVTVDTLEFLYISKGKYHKGNPIGTWKYIYNDKLDRKEKYKKNKCLTVFYYPNGKTKQQGYTRLEVVGKIAHWFYFGEWYNYNEKGKLIKIDTYENGVLKKTDSIK